MPADLAADQARGVAVLDPNSWTSDGDAYTVQGVSRPKPTAAPTVGALIPNTAKITDAPVTVRITGTGFVLGDRVVFGGATPPTSYVTDTEVRVRIDPKQWKAGVVQAMVGYTTRGPSNSLPFTWT